MRFISDTIGIHSSIRATPAMESGLTDHIWTIEELLQAGQEGNKKLTVSFEELAFSNMLTINALVELLTEKVFLAQQASGGVP